MRLKMRLFTVCLLFGLVFASFASGESNDEYTIEDEDEVVTEDAKISKVKPTYQIPEPSGNTFFFDAFISKSDYNKKWVSSEAKKDDVDVSIAKYDGKWIVEETSDNALIGDLALVLKSKAKHHAVSSKLSKPYAFSGKPLIISYEVRFQNGLECGGAYIKLLSKETNTDLKKFNDKTPYTIMFGPDKCGLDFKLHFIFRHKNPQTGNYEEKHAKKYTGKIDDYFTDKKTHLYTLILKPDSSYQILIDKTVINSGSLLSDVTPPVNPTEEIEDPNDKKPKDWDDREKIADPEASKPDDWDESELETIVDDNAKKPDGWLEDELELIPDPDADKPSDWDEEMDGEWEAPLINNPKCTGAPGCGTWSVPTIKNPKYKGKWSAPMIDNPNYKGIWKAQKIKNPDYFEDLEPYKMTPFNAIGLELWSMTEDIAFDNFIITDDQSVADTWFHDTWDVKSTEERASDTVGLGVWHTLKSSADKHQWLWAVYVVVILLPIFLLSICLCPKAGPITPEDIAAAKKKTDEPTPDDEDEATDEQTSKEAKKPSKADLDADNNDEGEEADVEDEEITKKDSPKDSKSPRRRKTRKD